MRRLPRLILVASLSVGGLVAPTAVHGAPDGNDGYEVRRGDYLFGIARQHGVTLDRLLRANDLTVTSVIHPGQRLAIPTAANPTPATPAPTGSRTYTVRPGDSLFAIARRHGVTSRSLLTANRLTLTSVIHPGQRLAIPAPAAPAPATPAPTGSRTYTVRPGDSLFAIARHHSVTLDRLLRANDLTVTSVIHPGQRLAIPTAANPTPATPAPTGSRTYTVRPGDSLFAIARHHGVTSRSLLAANRLTLTSVIHPGQRLAIPARAGSSPRVGSPSAPTTPAEVERIIREVWPDALEARALAIAWRESRYEPRAQGRCCSGLFQIYFDVHKGWLAELGVDSRADLYHPRTNAEAAFALYQRAGGWDPWALAGD